jgi:hypothetical protein
MAEILWSLEGKRRLSDFVAAAEKCIETKHFLPTRAFLTSRLASICRFAPTLRYAPLLLRATLDRRWTLPPERLPFGNTAVQHVVAHHTQTDVDV